VRDSQPLPWVGSVGHVSLEEDRMKTIIFAMIAGAGILLVPALEASAAPANGAAIANIGQQVDPVISVKKKSTKRCRADFKRDRAGYCVPNSNA
jgi:hypothetical protein